MAFLLDAATAADAPLALQLRRERGGPVIAVEPVSCRDLVDALGELWWESELRCGHTGSTLGDRFARVRTLEREAPETGRICEGFELTRVNPSGARAAGCTASPSRGFPRESLDHIALRRMNRLISEGEIETGALCHYTLVSGPDPDALVRGPEGLVPPRFARLPLRPLREKAEPFDLLEDDGDYPVFFTRPAHARAERISRRGSEVDPPVETGGLLVGVLYSCPETHDAFAVVVDVLEATGSTATQYSLAYSGETWLRIQTVMAARQREPATRHQRIVGQCHSHPFLPGGGAAPCTACSHVSVCTRSSAVLSSDDRSFCRAVFHAEPWQLSQVFGLDARSGRTESFYGQRGGALRRRGYYLIDDFQLDWSD